MTKSRDIFRVECADGRGPYNDAITPLKRSGAKCSALRPCPSDDGLTRELPPGWHYGFAQRADVEAWFPKRQREALQRSGWNVSHYVVDGEEVIEGKSGHQLVFNRDAAKLRETLPLAELSA